MKKRENIDEKEKKDTCYTYKCKTEMEPVGFGG